MIPIPIVLLIFMSSNYPQEPVDDGKVIRPTTLPKLKVVEETGTVTEQRFSSQANDLTAPDVKFGEDLGGSKILKKKIIREKVLEDGKEVKGQTPVPLYSLVKNECREGYALDENGVCQKIITVRSEKTFDSERKKRRKRFSPIYENKSLIFNGFANVNKKINKSDFEGTTEDCSGLYPGMVPDGTGGCKKLVHNVRL